MGQGSRIYGDSVMQRGRSARIQPKLYKPPWVWRMKSIQQWQHDGCRCTTHIVPAGYAFHIHNPLSFLRYHWILIPGTYLSLTVLFLFPHDLWHTCLDIDIDVIKHNLPLRLSYVHTMNHLLPIRPVLLKPPLGFPPNGISTCNTACRCYARRTLGSRAEPDCLEGGTHEETLRPQVNTSVYGRRWKATKVLSRLLKDSRVR